MFGPAKPMVLGSRSPRRAEILTTLGLDFRVVAPNVDEGVRVGEEPAAYVERVVDAKAQALESLLGAEPRAAVLVADTLVTLDGRIFGKPADAAAAFEMLSVLSGRAHTVMTRYKLATPSGATRARTVSSTVYFREASSEELRAYAESGEGLDKAGAYALQGLGSFLVERLDGSYSGVIGLPACELVRDLTELGLAREFPRRAR